MLAELGRAPFDSEDWIFEIKWDGTRTLAFIEDGQVRLMNRRQVNTTERFPEFAFLGELGDGIVLDGETVVLTGGKPDFGKLQSREHTTSKFRTKTAAQMMPATYVAFDILYRDFQSVMNRPLLERREMLAEVLADCDDPRLLRSDGVVNYGTTFLKHALAEGLEGAMAKKLSSRYVPGKRSDAWIKLKRRQSLLCAIIGFQPKEDDPNDLRSLILAADLGEGLRFVGKAGSGISEKLKNELNARLRDRLQKKPLVPCKAKGLWVEPGLYCEVSYMELTEGGEMRFPVFEKMVEA